MDARTIELLAASFARVAARRDDAATIFYTRLFTTAPALRPSSFKHDFESQKAKLMSTLAQVVEYYRIGVDPESYLARLGESQDGYGAQRVQFEALGDALIFTLGQVLGDDFTPEVRAAWVAAYGEVAAAMMRAGDVVARSLYPRPAAARL